MGQHYDIDIGASAGSLSHQVTVQASFTTTGSTSPYIQCSPCGGDGGGVPYQLAKSQKRITLRGETLDDDQRPT